MSAVGGQKRQEAEGTPGPGPGNSQEGAVFSDLEVSQEVRKWECKMRRGEETRRAEENRDPNQSISYNHTEKTEPGTCSSWNSRERCKL